MINTSGLYYLFVINCGLGITSVSLFSLLTVYFLFPLNHLTLLCSKPLSLVEKLVSLLISLPHFSNISQFG